MAASSSAIGSTVVVGAIVVVVVGATVVVVVVVVVGGVVDVVVVAAASVVCGPVGSALSPLWPPPEPQAVTATSIANTNPRVDIDATIPKVLTPSQWVTSVAGWNLVRNGCSGRPSSIAASAGVQPLDDVTTVEDPDAVEQEHPAS